MCGIVGGYGAKVQNKWVSDQTRNLAHRGPDSQDSIVLSNEVHFGSARLAMTDPLPRSNQPLRSDISAIVFNGEIYNHKDLKTELESEGVSFQTESDTEVLLQSLETWGDLTNLKAEGMYAFAYMNFKENVLILGRDCLGKKPLYYFVSNNTVHWSSSLKSLASLQTKQDLSSESIFEYMTLGYSIDPGTFKQEIFSVLPGTFLKFKFEDKSLIEYVPVKTPFRRIQLPNCKKFRDILRSAVVTRIEGHQTSAISLSGGLDSAIIALLASETNSKITAYSASWPDSDKSRYNDDAQRARIIAKNLGIEFQEVEIFETNKLDANLREYVRAMEEPNSNPSGLSMMNLYKAISQDSHRLVLTGDGADEILGGYPRYISLSRLPNLIHINSKFLSSQLDHERNRLNSRFFQLLVSQSSNKSYDNWLHWHWNFTPKELSFLSPKLFGAMSTNGIRRKFEFIEPQFKSNAVSFNMQLDREIWLAMESNRKLDRISMYYSIEARSPFQDENVIEYALKYMEETRYKILGKKLLWESFPEMKALGVRQDKAGFISPVGHWLRGNPDLVKSSIEALSCRLPLNSDYLEKLRRAPNSGEYRNIMKLWSLVVLSYWIQDES